MARNYADTGSSATTGRSFIKVSAKEALFTLPNGETTPAITGFFERLEMEFKDADPANELPARWQIGVVLDMQVGDSVPALYTVSMSSHWQNPILANTLNALAAAIDSPKWQDPDQRTIRIFLKQKERPGKKPICTAILSGSNAFGDLLPNKYPWNEAKRGFDGVPADMDEANAFWLGVAKAITIATGGTIVGEDKATIPLPNHSLGLGATTAMPTPPAQDDATKAMAFFDGLIAKGTDFTTAVKDTFAVLAKKGASDFIRLKVAAYCTDHGAATGAIAFGRIGPDGNLIVPPTDTKVTANPSPVDDLPF